MAEMTLSRPAATDASAGFRRRRRKERGRWLLRGVVMWALALLFLAPFLWMLSSSLKRDIDVFALPITWIPEEFQWTNYVKIWTGPHSMVHYFLNSGFVVILRIIGEVILCSLAGYAFGRLRFRGRNPLFLVFLASSIVPGQLLLVPRFMFFRELGLYDSLWALILPALSSVFGIFLLRQHFASAPAELGEAARIDGANEFVIFLRIYVPMAVPIITAFAILVFDSAWNDYETPLVMISSNANYTVPLGLTTFISDSGTISAALSMAGSVSSVIPILVFFLIFQRRFLASMARAGLR
ncbi:carbohydrate ABC transporter permease [Occultella gossypii]|uniref:Carbohydrate ABC transporter permease n=1 Tax=Occultella gossypii TaxID=2800820 RepID=A0ABS7S6P5_9MICO|nr:carbohydrate ABC transporter permease [Occultella gossypii]MBZ2194858.1 carbohydrate ABC transporter permease [Occultella gossypii]